MAHDPSKYPDNWRQISWRLKTERAQGQCEYIYPSGNRCEARDWEPHPTTGAKVVLSCCRLDHDPSHVDPERLAIFCQLHHNEHDAAYRSQQRLDQERVKAEAARREAGQQSFDLGDL